MYKMINNVISGRLKLVCVISRCSLALTWEEYKENQRLLLLIGFSLSPENLSHYLLLKN